MKAVALGAIYICKTLGCVPQNYYLGSGIFFYYGFLCFFRSSALSMQVFWK